MASNKIKYGLEKAYYALITENTDGNGNTVYTYGSPKALPGAVSLSLEASGDLVKFYADDVVYWQGAANNGYDGDFELAYFPETARADLLNEVKGADNVYYEYGDKQPAKFAFLFKFLGDQKGRLHVLYDCMLSRPSLEGQTKEDTIEPQTETLTISAVPRPQDGLCKASVDGSETVAASWFSAVHEPAAASS